MKDVVVFLNRTSHKKTNHLKWGGFSILNWIIIYSEGTFFLPNPQNVIEFPVLFCFLRVVLFRENASSNEWTCFLFQFSLDFLKKLQKKIAPIGSIVRLISFIKPEADSSSLLSLCVVLFVSICPTRPQRSLPASLVTLVVRSSILYSFVSFYLLLFSVELVFCLGYFSSLSYLTTYSSCARLSHKINPNVLKLEEC